MVEFCKSCGVSLPQVDLLFIQGRVIVSPDYICPECGKIANPIRKDTPDPSEKDILIKDGEIRGCTAR